MTKSEIEQIIGCIQRETPKFVFEERRGIYVKTSDLFDFLRNLAVEEEKTCGLNYEAMYEECRAMLGKSERQIESIKFDMHNLSIEHARYVGAVAAMETIFGRKFEPKE